MTVERSKGDEKSPFNAMLSLLMNSGEKKVDLAAAVSGGQ